MSAALAAIAGAVLAAGLFLLVIGGWRAREPRIRPPSRWARQLRSIRDAAHAPGQDRRRHRLRVGGWTIAGLAVWIGSGWPAAGIALTGVGIWGSWLLGSARIAQERIATLEALEAWCRRMADTLTGGGAMGLAQAITVSANHVGEPIAPAVRQLARQIRDPDADASAGLRAFADAVDDRVGDVVAAALLLALRQQSTGIARVLRQLADGVARDVRARRDVEAARAESRQSIRMLLIIQGGVLVMLALVPAFAAPYATALGQTVMALLLAGTTTLLIWMRRLALGQPSPRFLGSPGGAR